MIELNVWSLGAVRIMPFPSECVGAIGIEAATHRQVRRGYWRWGGDYHCTP